MLAVDPAAAHDAEVWDRLSEFVERDPAVAGGFRFRHALIRDAAYEGLSYRRRRELHGRVAEMLEERHADDPHEMAELLSLHFSRAGRAPETWRYACEAGRRAREKWAHREAVELYRRALDVASNVPDLDQRELLEIWEAVADSLRFQSEFEDAAHALSEARLVAPKDLPEAVRLMGEEGRLRQEWGRFGDAIRWYSRGAQARGWARRSRASTPTPARARPRLCPGSVPPGDVPGEHGPSPDQLVQEALPVNDTKTLAAAYLLLHLVHTLLGSPERAAFSGLALPLYEELGDLSGQSSTLNSLGIEAYYAATRRGDRPL